MRVSAFLLLGLTVAVSGKYLVNDPHPQKKRDQDVDLGYGHPPPDWRMDSGFGNPINKDRPLGPRPGMDPHFHRGPARPGSAGQGRMPTGNERLGVDEGVPQRPGSSHANSHGSPGRRRLAELLKRIVDEGYGRRPPIVHLSDPGHHRRPGGYGCTPRRPGADRVAVDPPLASRPGTNSADEAYGHRPPRVHLSDPGHHRRPGGYDPPLASRPGTNSAGRFGAPGQVDPEFSRESPVDPKYGVHPPRLVDPNYGQAAPVDPEFGQVAPVDPLFGIEHPRVDPNYRQAAPVDPLYGVEPPKVDSEYGRDSLVDPLYGRDPSVDSGYGKPAPPLAVRKNRRRA